MFESYKFKCRHLLVWVIGFLAGIIIWIGLTTLLSFLDSDQSWYVQNIVAIFAV